MPDWLQRLLPESARLILQPLLHSHVLLALGVLSALTFVASLLGMPYFLARLPADYFSAREQAALGLQHRRSALRVVLLLAKNLLGLTLIALGVLMLLLPGQGLLMVLVGLFFTDFPGKRRFERWIITRPAILRGIDALRARAGRPPLELRSSWLPKADPPNPRPPFAP